MPVRPAIPPFLFGSRFPLPKVTRLWRFLHPASSTSYRPYSPSAPPPLGNDRVTHYQVLNLPHSATQAEIKRRFYELSKAHHPDRNRNDPHAARRFVVISSAYSVVGNVERREKYDRDLRGRMPGPKSSHMGPTGARPATGLSRRRTQFHGPPPSFYKNGGWSTFKGDSRQSNSRGAGTGGSKDGMPGDVSHFDFGMKYRQHMVHEQRLASRFKGHSAHDDRGVLIPLIVVTMILLVAVSAASLGEPKARLQKDKD